MLRSRVCRGTPTIGAISSKAAGSTTPTSRSRLTRSSSRCTECRGLSSASVYPAGHFPSALPRVWIRPMHACSAARCIGIGPSSACRSVLSATPGNSAIRSRSGRGRSKPRRRTSPAPGGSQSALLMAELKPYRPRRARHSRGPAQGVFGDRRGPRVGHDRHLAADRAYHRPSRCGDVLRADRHRQGVHPVRPAGPRLVWCDVRDAALPGVDVSGHVRAAAVVVVSVVQACQSFRFVSTATAQDIMRRKRSRMLLAEDPAEAQAEALREAANGLGSADYAVGRLFVLLADLRRRPAGADRCRHLRMGAPGG